MTTSQISADHITSCWREEGLTAVLYPHHRIKMTELVKPGPAKPPQVQPQSVEPPKLPCPSSPPLDRRVAEKFGTFAYSIVSLHYSNYHKTQYEQLSCTNSTSQLSTSRISSHYLTEKPSNTSVLSCPKSSENRATQLPLPRPNHEVQFICFVGPPGVGKTSIESFG